ncbi:MAG: polysaccharide deacetylase family protein [Oscillospiraceae bacterium]|nr:polysaccharide deacetylase family protein [Oscillospiraceae bacterium]
MRRLLSIILCICLMAFPVRGEKETKYIALTFDDGPSGKFTRRLLDGLEERDVKATFLLCGYRLEDYPREAERIFREGHEIGLHSYSHGDMGKMTYKQAKEEIDKTAALLPDGCKPVFLRPPGGSRSAVLEQATKDAGLAILNWSVDPRDWATHDAQAVETFVTGTVRDGDVILLHDMCDCSVDAALAIIDKLQEQGFCFVTASQLAKIRSVTIQPGKVYSRFA